MPNLSQRTLGRVIKILSSKVPEDAYTYAQRCDFWRQKLFEWGFPDWFITGARERSFNWTVIIPALFSRTFKIPNTDLAVPKSLAGLRMLTAMALAETEDHADRESLRLSLQLDGFEVVKNKLRPVDGPISVEEERSRLLASLKKSRLSRQDIIAKHIEDAEEHFNQGKNHSAIGEARSALQAVIEETVTLMEQRTRDRSGGGTKNQIEFLSRERILSNDEQQAFIAAWVFLSSGNHPGLPPEEDGRVGTILCLEFIQILLVKCENLLS